MYNQVITSLWLHSTNHYGTLNSLLDIFCPYFSLYLLVLILKIYTHVYTY